MCHFNKEAPDQSQVYSVCDPRYTRFNVPGENGFYVQPCICLWYWQAMQALAEDSDIVIKKQIGSTVAVWDCNEYIFKGGKHPGDTKLKRFARILLLMRRFCSTSWEQEINFFKAWNLKEKLLIDSLNTSCMSIKRLLT